MDFIDTRLHIQVTSSIEYRLPSATQIVRNTILGSSDSKAASAGLRSLARTYECPLTHATRCEASALDAQCAYVCAQLEEHLQRVSNELLAHLQWLADEVAHVTKRSRTRLHQANAVRARYREVDAVIVEQEYRQEVTRISDLVDARLDELRACAMPVVSRPPELSKGFETLKADFARAYGTVSTSRLTESRTYLEHCVKRIEATVVDDFVSRAREIVPCDA